MSISMTRLAHMFQLITFVLISTVQAQYFFQQRQQYPTNNYNQWPSRPKANPVVPVRGTTPNRTSAIQGNLLHDETSTLPYGAQIIILLADVSVQDGTSRLLNTLVLTGSYRFPIAYLIPYSMAQVQATGNTPRQYIIQVRIEKDGQVLYANDPYTSVQLKPAPTKPVNIVLRKLLSPMYPGGNGIFTTRPTMTNTVQPCLQNPEIGPCKASIEQYYFNAQSRSCQTFLWGGCAGNQNRFNSRDECERACTAYWQPALNNGGQKKWTT